MYSKINYSPYYYLNSGHKSLLDFGLELDGKTKDEKLFKIGQNQNMVHDKIHIKDLLTLLHNHKRVPYC